MIAALHRAARGTATSWRPSSTCVRRATATAASTPRGAGRADRRGRAGAGRDRAARRRSIDALPLCRAELGDRPSRPAPPRTDVPHRSISASSAWPAGVPEGGRHGVGPDDRPAPRGAAVPQSPQVSRALSGSMPASGMLVLGTEELMYLPLRLAEALGRRRATSRVLQRPRDRPRWRSTSRVPAHQRHRTSPRHDDPGRRAGRASSTTSSARQDPPRWTDVVVVVDPPARHRRPCEPGWLLAALAPHAPAHEPWWCTP